MLRIERLTCAFAWSRSERGLESIDLQVDPGEFAVIVGPNGSGKSTLLDCISGHRDDFSGAIRSGDIVLSSLSPRRRAEIVNLLRHDEGLGLPNLMTIGDVLGLWAEQGAGYRRLHRSVSESHLESELRAFLPHLESRLSDQVATLSGGEAQLLSLLCLQLSYRWRKPRAGPILLLDEHTANLDDVLARAVMERSRELARNFGASCLCVTHSLHLASECADSIYFLAQGRTTPMEPDVLSKPPDQRLEWLAGQMLASHGLPSLNARNKAVPREGAGLGAHNRGQ